MTTLTDIFSVTSQKAFADYVGTSPSNIGFWKRSGEIPSAYALRVKEFCKLHHLAEPSDDLFSFLPVEASDDL